LKLNKKDVVLTIIYEGVNRLYRAKRNVKDKQEDLNLFRNLTGTEHVSLHSALKSCTIKFIEAQFNRDTAFISFQKHLTKSLSSIFNKQINLGEYDKVYSV
jgi:hypothetical protein